MYSLVIAISRVQISAAATILLMRWRRSKTYIPIYRKTSNTSPRLLLEEVSWTLDPPACIGDPDSNGDPTCIETLSTCHIKLLCVYGIPDFKYETQQTNTFTSHFVETVRLLGLLLSQLAPGGPPRLVVERPGFYETRLVLEVLR